MKGYFKHPFYIELISCFIKMRDLNSEIIVNLDSVWD